MVHGLLVNAFLTHSAGLAPCQCMEKRFDKVHVDCRLSPNQHPTMQVFLSQAARWASFGEHTCHVNCDVLAGNPQSPAKKSVWQ